MWNITYLISDTTAIKIGHSMIPKIKARMAQIKTCNPRKIFLLGGFIGKNMEKILHKRFKEDKIKGEWYNFDILIDILDMPDFLYKDEILKKIQEYKERYALNKRI